MAQVQLVIWLAAAALTSAQLVSPSSVDAAASGVDATSNIDSSSILDNWASTAIGHDGPITMSASPVATPGGQVPPFFARPASDASYGSFLDPGPLIGTTQEIANGGLATSRATGAFLLESGCIYANELDIACPPAGLGSRFLSVFMLPQVRAVGAVSDAGILVFFGLGADSRKCAYAAGPYTPQVSHVLLEVTQNRTAALWAARWNWGGTLTQNDRWTLLALTRTGSLEAMRALPNWWSMPPPGGGSTGWLDWTTAALNATSPSASACADITRSTAHWAMSNILCPRIAASAATILPPPVCISSHGPFTAFAATTCQCVGSGCPCTSNCRSNNLNNMGTIISAVRRVDGVGIGYSVGADFFDSNPVFSGSLLNGILPPPNRFTPLDPSFAPFRACTHSAYPLVGRALDGTYFYVPAFPDVPAARTVTPTYGLAFAVWAPLVGVAPVTRLDALRTSNCDRYCAGGSLELTRQFIDGPFIPGAMAWANYLLQSGCLVPLQAFGAGIRPDGSIHAGIVDVAVITDKPASFTQLTASIRSDIVCFSFRSSQGTTAGAASVATYNSLIRCIGAQDATRAFRAISGRCDPNSNNVQSNVRVAFGHAFELGNSGSWYTNAAGATTDWSYILLTDTGISSRNGGTGYQSQRFASGWTGCSCTSFGAGCGCGGCSACGSQLVGWDGESNAFPVAVSSLSPTYRVAGDGWSSQRAIFSNGLGSGTNVPASGNDAPPNMVNAMGAVAAADTFYCGILQSLSLHCTAAAATVANFRATATAQGFTFSTVNTASIIGTQNALAVTWQQVAGGTDVICGRYTVTSTGRVNVACFSSSLGTAAHLITTGDPISGTNGAWLARNLSAVMGSGNAADVCVGASFACLLSNQAVAGSATRRHFCWGANTAAARATVAEANASPHTFTKIVCAANSLCGITDASTLRCHGGLRRYIVSGLHRDDFGLVTGGPGPAATKPKEIILDVGASGGSDAACASGASTNCATLRGAIENLPAIFAANGGFVARSAYIRVWGSSTSAQLTVPTSVQRLTIVGVTPGAAITFPSCPAGTCMDLSAPLPSAVVIANITFSMGNASAWAPFAGLAGGGSGTAPVPLCQTFLHTAAAQVRFSALRFVDMACSVAILHLASPTHNSAAARINTQAALQRVDAAAQTWAGVSSPVTRLVNVQACEQELMGVLFFRVAAPYGVLTRYAGSVCVDSIAADSVATGSLLLVDKVMRLRVQRLTATALTATMRYPGSPGAVATGYPSAESARIVSPLAVLSRCGGLLRLNSIADAEVGNVTAIADVVAGGAGGGAVCVTDEVTVASGTGATYAASYAGTVETRPALISLTIANCSFNGTGTLDDGSVPQVAVPSLTSVLTAGGGAIMVSRLRRTARVVVSNIAVVRSTTRGPQHRGGAIALIGLGDTTVSDVACRSTAAASGPGGCLFLQDTPVATLRSLSVVDSSALDGGGCLAFVRVAPVLASVTVSQCTATAGPGGAFLYVDVPAVNLTRASIADASATRSHGGAVAMVGSGALASLSLAVFESSFSRCTAGQRGGALSVLSALDGAAPVSVSIARSSLTSCTVLGAPALPPVARTSATYRTFAGNGYSTSALSAKAVATVLGGGALAVVFLSADAAATSATVSVPVTGTPGSLAVALPAVDILSSTFANVTAAVGDGGAVLISRSAETRVVARALVDTVIITGASATSGDGGAIYADSAALTLSDTLLYNCSAAGDGGAVAVRGTALTAASLIAAQNTAGGDGGAISAGNCAITGVTLVDPGIVEAAALPSASPSPTASVSPSSTLTASPTPSASGSESAASTQLVSLSATSTRTSPTSTATVSSSGVAPATPASTASITASAASTPTRTASGTPSATVTALGAAAAPVSSVWSAASALDVAQRLSNLLAFGYSLADANVTALFTALRGVHLVANTAGGAGGGLALASCDAYIGGTHIVGNAARDGGGIAVSGASELQMCVASVTGNMAVGATAASAALRLSRTAAAASNASSALAFRATDALFAPAAADMSSSMRGDTAMFSAGGGLGGGIAVLEPSGDVHLCSARACDTIARLSRRGVDLSAGTASSMAAAAAAAAAASTSLDPDAAATATVRFRISLSSLWPYLLHQAGAAATAFAAGEAASRTTSLPRGCSAAAAPYSTMTSVSRARPSMRHGTLTDLSWPLAGSDYTGTLLPLALAAVAAFPTGASDNACPMAANFAAGSGGDVAFASEREPSVLASSPDTPALYASRIASVASHADGAGGSIAVRALPILLDGSVIMMSSAGKGAGERLNATALALGIAQSARPSMASFPQDTSASIWDGGCMGFGGALALHRSVGVAIINSSISSSFARAGGAVWMQPPLRPLTVSSSSTVVVAGSSAASTVTFLPADFPAFNATAAAITVASALLDSSASASTASSASAASSAVSSTAPAIVSALGAAGGILMSSLTVSNVSAVAAGGAFYAAAASLPPCTNCIDRPPLPRLTSLSASTSYGTRGATLPVRLALSLTPYGATLLGNVTVPGRDFSGVTALSVTSATAVPSAPLTFTLLDASNATASADFSTACTAHAFTVDSRADLQALSLSVGSMASASDRPALALLNASARYTAEAGVISLFPFGLAAAPGQAALLVLRCAVSYAGDSHILVSESIPVFVRKLDLRLVPVPVLANGTACEPASMGRSAVPACAAALAGAVPGLPLPILSSTLQARYPPDWSLLAAFVEATGLVASGVPDLSCSLTLAPDIAAGASSSTTARVLTGDTGVSDSARLSAGAALLRPLVNGPPGSRILLQMLCTWETGEVILSTQVSAIILRPRLVWQLDGVAGAGAIDAATTPAFSAVSRIAGSHQLLAQVAAAVGAAAGSGTGIGGEAAAALSALGLIVTPSTVGLANATALLRNASRCGSACASSKLVPAGTRLGFAGGVSDVDGSIAVQTTAAAAAAAAAGVNASFLPLTADEAACALPARVMVKPLTVLLAPAAASGSSSGSPTGGVVTSVAASIAPPGLFGLVLRPRSPSSGRCSAAVATGAYVTSGLASPDAVLVLDGDVRGAYSSLGATGGVQVNATVPPLDPSFYAALLNRLPSAALSSVDGSTLAQLDPMPSLLVVADGADGGGGVGAPGSASSPAVVLTKGTPQCSLRILSSRPGGSSAVVVGDPQPVVREEDGSITFARTGISNTVPGDWGLSLQAACLLPSGLTVTSPPLPITIRNLTTGFRGSSVPLAALPSGPRRPVPLNPPPTLLLRETVELPGAPAGTSPFIANVSVATRGFIPSNLRSTSSSAAGIPLHEVPPVAPSALMSLAIRDNSTLLELTRNVPSSCVASFDLLPSAAADALFPALLNAPANTSVRLAPSAISWDCLLTPRVAVAAPGGDISSALLPPAYLSVPAPASVPCSVGAATVSRAAAAPAASAPSLDPPSITQVDGVIVTGGELRLAAGVGIVGLSGAVVSLGVTCTYVGRQYAAASPPLLLVPFAVTLRSVPLSLVYPSSKARGVIAMSPAPVLDFRIDAATAEATRANLAGAGGPFASANASAFTATIAALDSELVSLMQSNPISCSLDVWGSAFPSAPHALIDLASLAASSPSASVKLSTADGRSASFTVGVAGPLASSFAINASCGWLSGETLPLPGSLFFNTPVLGSAWETGLPPVLLPSSDALALPVRAPLRLRLLRWNSTSAAAAYSAAVSAPASGGSGSGSSSGSMPSPAELGASNLIGFQLGCSLQVINASISLLPPTAATEVAVSPLDGTWSSVSFGVKSLIGRGVRICLRPSCTFFNGEDIPVPFPQCAWLPNVSATFCGEGSGSDGSGPVPLPPGYAGSPVVPSQDCPGLGPLSPGLVPNEPIVPPFGILAQAHVPFHACFDDSPTAAALAAELRAIHALAQAAVAVNTTSGGSLLSPEARMCAGIDALPNASSSSTSPLPAVVQLPWRLVGANQNTLRCQVRASRITSASMSESVDFRGAVSRTADAPSGVARYEDMAITPSSSQLASMQVPIGTVNVSGVIRPFYPPLRVDIAASCFINEISASDGPSPYNPAALPILAVAFYSPFPPSFLPVLQNDPIPITPAVSVAIGDINVADLTGQPPLPLSATCSLKVTGVLYPPLLSVRGGAPYFSFDNSPAPDTGKVFFAALVGTPSRQLAGSTPAAFTDLAVSATLGSQVTVEATCVRSAGGDVRPRSVNVTVRSVVAEWVQGMPSAVLTDRVSIVGLRLFSRVLLPGPAVSNASNASEAWRELPGSREPGPADVTCSALLRSSDGSLILTAKSVASNDTASDGTVWFRIDVTTKSRGVRGSLQASCSVRGQTVYSPPSFFDVLIVYVRACAPAPLVWLPSEGSTRAALRPVPSVTLSTIPPSPAAIGSSPAAYFGDGGNCPSMQVLSNGDQQFQPAAAQVSGAGAVCRVRVAAAFFGFLNASAAGAVASGAYVLDPPTDGYTLLPSQSEWEPITTPNLFVTARYGTLLALNVSCRRVNGEDAVPATLWVRMVYPRVDWGVPLPAKARPGTPFNTSVVLRDDYGALLAEQAARLPELLPTAASGGAAAPGFAPSPSRIAPFEQLWLRGSSGSLPAHELMAVLRASAASATAPYGTTVVGASAFGGGSSTYSSAFSLVSLVELATNITGGWVNSGLAAAARGVIVAYLSGAVPSGASDAAIAAAAAAAAPPTGLPRSAFAADPARNDSVSVCRLLGVKLFDPSTGANGSAAVASPYRINIMPVPQLAAPGEDPEDTEAAAVAAAEAGYAARAADIVRGAVPGLLLQGAAAVARSGTAIFPAIAINARLGTVVEGMATCATGSLPAPGELRWRLAMDSCSKGDAPDSTGMICTNCGNGKFSDGGEGATVCTVCPVRGVTCTGGILNLLPGFFRADKQDSVNEATELHPCWFDTGCIVNTETSSRRWNDTHYCAVGYTGPLCALCDPNGGSYGTGYARQGTRCLTCAPPIFNLLVALALPTALIAAGFFVAGRRATEVNPRAPLTRIIITHVQSLGTLLGQFVSKGTQSFREAFGVSEVAGSSPLALQPIQCALRFGFYEKFVITLLLPVLLVSATLFAAWCQRQRCTIRARRACARRCPCCGGGAANSQPQSNSKSKPGITAQRLPALAAIGRSGDAGEGAAAANPAASQPPRRQARRSIALVIGDGEVDEDVVAAGKGPSSSLASRRTRVGSDESDGDKDKDKGKDGLDAVAEGTANSSGSDSENEDRKGRGGRVAFLPASSGGAGGGTDGKPDGKKPAAAAPALSRRRVGPAAPAASSAAAKLMAAVTRGNAAANAAAASSGPGVSLGMTANPLIALGSSRGMTTGAGSGAAQAGSSGAPSAVSSRGLVSGASNAANTAAAAAADASARPDAVAARLQVQQMTARGTADLEFWRGQAQPTIDTATRTAEMASQGGALARPADALTASRGKCCSRLGAALLQPSVMGPLVFVVNLSFNSVLSTAFSAFSCHSTVVAGKRYLTEDFGTECGTPTHLIFRIVAGVIMVTFGLGIPVGFSKLLKRNRHRLYAPSFFASFAFLYDGLSVERGQQGYDVQFAVPRKVLLVAIASLLKDSVLQLLAGALLMLGALIALLVLSPYSLPLYSILESLSVSTILVTIIATLAYVRSQGLVTACAGYADNVIPPGAEENCGASRSFLAKMDVGATTVLIAINIATIAVFIFVFVRLAGVRAIRARVAAAGSAAAVAAGFGAKPGLLTRLVSACRCCKRGAGQTNTVAVVPGASDAPPLTPDQITDQVLLLLEGTVKLGNKGKGKGKAGDRGKDKAKAKKGHGLLGRSQQQSDDEVDSNSDEDSEGPGASAPRRGFIGRMWARVLITIEIPLHLACERAEALTAVLKAAAEAEAAVELKRASMNLTLANSAISSGAAPVSPSSAGSPAAGAPSAGAASAAAAAAKHAALRFAAAGGASGVLARTRSAATMAGSPQAGAGSGKGGVVANAPGDAAAPAASARPRKQRPSLFAEAAAARRHLGAVNAGVGGSGVPDSPGFSLPGSPDAAVPGIGMTRAVDEVAEEARKRAALAMKAVTAFKRAAAASLPSSPSTSSSSAVAPDASSPSAFGGDAQPSAAPGDAPRVLTLNALRRAVAAAAAASKAGAPATGGAVETLATGSGVDDGAKHGPSHGGTTHAPDA